jgi:hypothetical protein
MQEQCRQLPTVEWSFFLVKEEGGSMAATLEELDQHHRLLGYCR